MTHAYNREREYFVWICGAQKQKNIVFPQHSHLGRLREFAAKVSCFKSAAGYLRRESREDNGE